MEINDLHRQYIENAPDPAVTWRWFVKMPNIVSYVGLSDNQYLDGTGLRRVYNPDGKNNEPGTDAIYRQINTVGKGHSIFVEAISLPSLSINAETRQYAATTYKYPGFTGYDAATITFYEDRYYSILNLLNHWQTLVFQPNNTYGMPYATTIDAPSYKKQIIYYAYDVYGTSSTDPSKRNKSSLTMAVLLNGAWPTRIGQLDSDYEKNGRIQIQAEFAFDSMGTIFYKYPS